MEDLGRIEKLGDTKDGAGHAVEIGRKSAERRWESLRVEEEDADSQRRGGQPE